MEGRRAGHGSHPTACEVQCHHQLSPGPAAQRQCPSWVHPGFEGTWAAVAPGSGRNPFDFEEVSRHGWNKAHTSSLTAGTASQPS